jgi:hypothetical protein
LLSIRKSRRQGERERDDDCLVFHDFGFVCLLSLLMAVSGCRAAVERTQAIAGSFAANCEASVNPLFAIRSAGLR